MMPLFRKRKAVTATIRRIWTQAPPGAPWYYWVYVLFESHGERIKIHLKRGQAKRFTKAYSEGDTGHLEYAGDRMMSWQMAGPDNPLQGGTDIKVFISYAHEWAEDAEYVAQVFRSYGLEVWLDVEELRVGDSLNNKVVSNIKSASYFVPLLSPEYFASPWCIKEFELAVNEDITALPVKVTEGSIVFPPHMKQLYGERLGEPVYLDLRGRDPSTQLKDLASQMLEETD